MLFLVCWLRVRCDYDVSRQYSLSIGLVEIMGESVTVLSKKGCSYRLPRHHCMVEVGVVLIEYAYCTVHSDRRKTSPLMNM